MSSTDVVRTEVDAANEVYSQLRSEEGQTPSDDDITLITNKIGPSVEMLSALDVITIDDTDAIPNAVFIPFCTYVAEQCAPDLAARPKNLQTEQLAIRELKLISRTRPTYEPQRTSYF